MSHSQLELRVGGRAIDRFLSYRVESSLFVADDAWEVALADGGALVLPGQEARLFVNGAPALVGIVDAVTTSGGKSGVRRAVRGRDLMGLLVDSYVSGDTGTQKDTDLETVARTLLADIPFINRSAVVFGTGNADRAVPLAQREEDYEFTQIEPAKTVFETLRELALARGMLFWCLPDGTFVFGTPKTGGRAVFQIQVSKKGGNALSWEHTEDFSRQYSRVTVTGQRQGTDDLDAGDTGFTGTATNPDFPFEKPFAAVAEYHDGQDPDAYARIIMDKQRFDGFSLTYTVPGHSQNGVNWTVNEVCRVDDEVARIHGDFLIHERIFELSKDRGVFTTVRLSRLGVLPA